MILFILLLLRSIEWFYLSPFVTAQIMPPPRGTPNVLEGPGKSAIS